MSARLTRLLGTALIITAFAEPAFAGDADCTYVEITATTGDVRLRLTVNDWSGLQATSE